MKKFSIIIPLYNAEFLKSQLLTISSLVYPKESFEVVYVDDGSDDNYREEYKRLFDAFPDLKIQYHSL